MPKKLIFSKEKIIDTSFQYFKNEGIDFITARNIAKILNCSTVPIYSSIGSMDILKDELIDKAKKLFIDYITTTRTGIKFLDIGMGIVIFAREEPKLFFNIFLKENIERDLLEEFISIIHKEVKKDERFFKISDDIKNELFLNCWIYAHGLSTLIASGYIKNPTDEYIKEKLMNNPAKLLYSFLENN